MRDVRGAAIIVIVLSIVAGCGDVNSALKRSVEARHTSEDLYLQFTKAAEASNRAVMADTDERSEAFAHEAEQAKQAVLADVALLEPVFRDVRYQSEARFLQDFMSRFEEYRVLDQRNNTNGRLLVSSLVEKQKLIASCEQSLRALRDALAKRGYPRGR
jgi:hypothetical protein